MLRPRTETIKLRTGVLVLSLLIVQYMFKGVFNTLCWTFLTISLPLLAPPVFVSSIAGAFPLEKTSTPQLETGENFGAYCEPKIFYSHVSY